MTRRTESRRTRKRTDPIAKLLSQIMPQSPHTSSSFALVDVANHSDADQRSMVRSGEKKTVRRKSRIERLLAAGVIEQHHVNALQWYADQHEAGFATIGVTANYEGAGGGGFAAVDLLAKNIAQAEARGNYFWARSFIPDDLRAGFELVVIGNADLTAFPSAGNSGRTQFRNRRAAFLLACNLLHIGIQKVTG